CSSGSPATRRATSASSAPSRPATSSGTAASSSSASSSAKTQPAARSRATRPATSATPAHRVGQPAHRAAPAPYHLVVRELLHEPVRRARVRAAPLGGEERLGLAAVVARGPAQLPRTAVPHLRNPALARLRALVALAVARGRD